MPYICYGCKQTIEKGQRWKHYNSEMNVFLIRRRMHKECQPNLSEITK